MPNSDDATGPTAPGIEDAETFAVIFDNEPAVIVLARHRATLIAADGALVAEDALTEAVRAHGARPMIDLAFDAAPARGWQAHLDTDAARLHIATPAHQALYQGTLHADPRWHQLIAANAAEGRGLVVITGSAPANHDAALDMIEQGRASWIRIPLEISP